MPTARPRKALIIPIATRSLASSTRRRSTGDFRGHEEKGAGRGFQERGARMAAQGGFRGCARPRFPDQGVGARCSLRRLRPRRQRGLLSAWASTTIRRLSRCRRFAVGGQKSAPSNIPTPNASSSPPTAAARMVHGFACGNSSCSASPTNSASTSKFTTSRRERANGTRLVPAKAGIEHRLFSFVTMNWRARPLVSHQVIVELVSSTTTETGLKVLCQLDPNPYPKASPSPTTRWPLSISPGPISTPNGTTPSNRAPTAMKL